MRIRHLQATFLMAAFIPAPQINSGYRQMYDLDFHAAHETFTAWERAHPEDPLGPVSNAAAYLFSELDRLHVLQAEFFVDDAGFKEADLVPDPRAKQAFDAELSHAESLAGTALARSPRDANALFARVLALGLRSDYQGLIEKRYLSSLSGMKRARKLAEDLLAIEPACYDALLAVGVENYILSLKPAPVRWLLRLGGAQTDKQEGIAKLKLTAEKGRLLAPFARLLLAVAALRDHDRDRARALLGGLAREFPHNRLYVRELDLLAAAEVRR